MVDASAAQDKEAVIAKVIADNLPRPYSLDDVWRQVPGGAEFDLEQAHSDSRDEWLAMARAVIATLSHEGE